MSKRLVIRASPLLKSQAPGDKQKDPAEGYSHPHSVGKAEITDAHCDGFGDCSAIKFAGTQYLATGKTGKSFHDDTPVRQFESEDGHTVWLDEHGRVHADSETEVDSLRKKHEASQAEGAGALRPKDPDSGGAAASEGDEPDGDAPQQPDFEAMSDEQLNGVMQALQAEIQKRSGGKGGGDVFKAIRAAGRLLIGRGK